MIMSRYNRIAISSNKFAVFLHWTFLFVSKFVVIIYRVNLV